MKKGHIRLIIFEILIMFILFLNSFVINMLSGYKMPLFLLLISIFFFFRFGFEKDKHRYIKDAILEITIFLLVFLILYYLLGVVVGFSRTDNYYTIKGIIDFIIPAVLYVILREYLRYNMSCKSQGSTLASIITVTMFICLDVSQAIYTTSFNTNYEYLTFISFTLLPSICSNIALTYITHKVGYKPALLYSLVMRLYRYLLPIIPNPSPYIYSIIMLLVPAILTYRIYKLFKNTKDEDITREYNKKRLSSVLLLHIPVIIMIYFVSGQFRFHAVAVASGSMVPSFYKGDVVIIDRQKVDLETLKEGQVLAVKHGNILVIHRLYKKVNINNEYVLYTKGDANDEVDNFTTKEENLYGVVNYVIPYIGLPTVWFNES